MIVRKLPSAAHSDTCCLPKLRQGWDLHSRRALQPESKRSESSRGMDLWPLTRVYKGWRFSCGLKWLLPQNISPENQEILSEVWVWRTADNEPWNAGEHFHFRCFSCIWDYIKINILTRIILLTAEVHCVWGGKRTQCQPQGRLTLCFFLTYPLMIVCSGSEAAISACCFSRLKHCSWTYDVMFQHVSCSHCSTCFACRFWILLAFCSSLTDTHLKMLTVKSIIHNLIGRCCDLWFYWMASLMAACFYEPQQSELMWRPSTESWILRLIRHDW